MAAISDFAWQSCRRFLEGPGTLILPQHTRDALFQLICDLRTNVPKDRKWAYQHGQALKPQSLPGWIALSSLVLAGLSVSSFISSAVLVTSVGVGAVASALASFIGAVVGFWALVLSACLFGSTFFLAGCSAFLATGYVFVTTVEKVARFSRVTAKRALDRQGSSRQRVSSHKPAIADESIQMLATPKSQTSTKQSSVSAVPSTIQEKEPKIFPSKQRNQSENQTHSAMNGHVAPTTESSGESEINANGLASKDLKSKKGRTFAQIQEDLQNSHSPKASSDKDLSDISRDEIKESTKSDFKAEGAGKSILAPDFSPGRAEAQHHFADIQKAVKGVSGDELRPEGGPTVEGRFAEAVHPDAFHKGEVSGFPLARTSV